MKIKNKNILINFFLIFFFIILFYLIYKSEYIWVGTQRKYYLKYFICCIIVIILFIFLSFNDKNKYPIIIIISTIFGLYSFEGYLTFKKIEIVSGKKSFDNQTPLEFYENQKKKDDNVVLVTYPITLQRIQNNNFFYFSGISKKKTIHCNEGNEVYGFSFYQSDRYGFNNPDEEWNNEEIEFLLTGDSSTHGACINRPYDIASNIRFYSKKNVLNLGYSGNGPLNEYAVLREYLSPGVKKVLWIYNEGNDLIDLKLELEVKLLNFYLNDRYFSQNLKFKQDLIDNYNQNIINNIYRKIEKYKNLIDFFKLNNLRSLLFSIAPNHPLEVLPQFKSILKEANDFVSNNNSKLFFVYLPEKGRYLPKFQDNKEKIKKIINELNIEFIDIDQEVFKQELDPLKLFTGAHYTKYGYQKISYKIYEKTK